MFLDVSRMKMRLSKVIYCIIAHSLVVHICARHVFIGRWCFFPAYYSIFWAVYDLNLQNIKIHIVRSMLSALSVIRIPPW